MFEICGKVALVTGGASGLGLATIEQLLSCGLKGVTIVDVNEELGQHVAAELKKRHGCEKVVFVKVNVADRNQFEDAFKKTIAAFQTLDIVINSAGIIKDLVWEEEIAVNLGGTMTGTYFGFEKYLPNYKSGPEGVIVNLASVAGLVVVPYAPFYSATKSGVIQLSRAFGTSKHYNRHPVRVMAVCPGFTDTPIKEMHSERHLAPELDNWRTEEVRAVTVQPPEHVGKAIVQMIRDGPNGSVWVVNNYEDPYMVTFPPHPVAFC